MREEDTRKGPHSRTLILVAPTSPGIGGLGLQVDFALAALRSVGPVRALGPPAGSSGGDSWQAVQPLPAKLGRIPPFRWNTALWRELLECRIGSAAEHALREVELAGLYAFTGVGLEALRRAREQGIPTVLDSPNTHIRNFREVIDREAIRLGELDRGPPSARMVQRIEDEYRCATFIRTASQVARRSLIDRGLPASSVIVQDLSVDLKRHTAPERRERTGPLRVCYVGSVDFRKGVVHLLRAIRLLGRGVSLRIVGATCTRAMARLIARESTGLDVVLAPGDPRPVYATSEVLVLPSLEDGFGYVVAEAMASSMPVIVTDRCGSAEWVRHGETGWVVSGGSPEPIALALEQALSGRGALESMGRAARAAMVSRMQPDPVGEYGRVLQVFYG